MWRLVLVGALCACGLSEQAVSLAELDARAHFSRGGAAILTLADEHFMEGPCSVLPPTTTATMNGIPAEIVSLGGIQNGRANDWCGAARFDWPYDSTTPDSSTFEISDGSTTMTLVAWRPFTVRSFALVSHPDLRLRATDQVTARTSFADDGPLHSWAFVRGQRDQTVLFDLDAPEGLVMDGPELRFTIPAIPPGPLQLWIEGVPTVRFDRCDAPRGCEVESMARAMLEVTIVP